VAHALAIALLVGGVGCGLSDQGAEPEVDDRPLTAAEKAVVESDESFGLRLFGAVNEAMPDENVVVSPLSVSMALGMALNGANGETHAEIVAALEKTGLSESEINDTYAHLLSYLPDRDDDVEVAIANSVWYREDFTVEQDYLDGMTEAFKAKIASLDFTDPTAPGVINGWVSSNTGGRIPTIIDSIPQEAVAYLINAVYFKGAWRNEFDPDDTRDGAFHNGDGTVSTVPMMRLSATLPQYRNDSYTAIDLPYGDSLFSMTILLPTAGGVNDLATNLDSSELRDLDEGLQPSRAELELPRFEVSTGLTLNESLKALGMVLPFDPDNADFGRINPVAQLYISRVLHKTFVSVNEEGTEAAAATAVEVGVTSMPEPIRVDRPFLFLIRERHTGTLLFAGKVAFLP
jgi:serpin B